MKVLAIVGDLMFQSRLEALLQRAGVPYASVTPEAAREAIEREQPTHVVVNLADAPVELMEHLSGPYQLFGFGPHVDRERFLSARRQGATVVANSALEPRLRHWLGVESL